MIYGFARISKLSESWTISMLVQGLKLGEITSVQVRSRLCFVVRRLRFPRWGTHTSWNLQNVLNDRIHLYSCVINVSENVRIYSDSRYRERIFENCSDRKSGFAMSIMPIIRSVCKISRLILQGYLRLSDKLIVFVLWGEVSLYQSLAKIHLSFCRIFYQIFTCERFQGYPLTLSGLNDT